MRFTTLFRRTAVLAATAAVIAVATDASAVLVNQYTFNDGTANDSVGGQHGVVVDPTGSAFYSGGELQLTNNNGANSNQDFSQPTTAGAYVDLPNGLLSSAATNGDIYQFSMEFWATVETNRPWARLADFGGQDDGLGENDSTSGVDSAYLIVVPSAGIGGGDPMVVSTRSVTNDEALIQDPGGALATGVEHHIVVTVDQLDSTAGLNGTLKMYLNNTLVATGPVEEAGAVDFTFINDNNNWLGRAQWPDALFDGSYNEFNLYSHALTDAEVAANFATGPVPGELAVPTLVIDRATGEMTIENQTGEQLTLEGYTITSGAGSLDAVDWDSINASNTFEPGVSWTASSTTDTEITEASTGSGGLISSGGDATIGLAWNASSIEDIAFTFTLAGGTPLTGQVEYVNVDGGFSRSDLDADGDIDADDFAIFAANSGADLGAASAYALAVGGDLNGDGENNYADFRLFKADFVAANGAEAFAALTGGVAPEPAAMTLALLMLAAAPAGRRVR